MKVLFQDLINDSTITSLNASANYPVGNIRSEFIRTRYQSTTSSDTITIILDETKDINCVGLAWINATKIIVTVSSFATSYAETINDPLQDCNFIYFDTVQDAYKITIYIEKVLEETEATIFDCEETEATTFDCEAMGATVFDAEQYIPFNPDYYGGIYPFIGKVSFGECTTMDNLGSAGTTEPMIDNTFVSNSPFGSVLQNYIEPLQGYALQFKDYTRDEYNNIQYLYKKVGVGKPLFIDITEDNHDFLVPIISQITITLSPVRNGRRYDFLLNILEAR